MNDFSLDKLFDYIKRLRLYEVSSLVSLTISSVSALPITRLLRQLAISLFGENDYVPVLRVESISVIVWFAAFIFLRKIMIWIKKCLLNRISINENYPQIDFNFMRTEMVDRFQKEWESQGHLTFSKKGLLVTSSNSGALIKSKGWQMFQVGRIWKDFRATIEVDFGKH